MAGVLDGVNQRTQLVGQNRLELLMFRLAGRQRFGINVFKVQEVIQCPPLRSIPHANAAVRGMANIRGKTIPVIDLGAAIGKAAISSPNGCYVIITEYNRTVQGFLVKNVERIVNMNWEEILPPPKGSGASSYMTAVTNVDDGLVEIIDVEKILAEIIRADTNVSDTIVQGGQEDGAGECRILVADDSSVARKQIQRTLEQLAIKCTVVNDGRAALNQLKAWADEGQSISQHVSIVLSDIEMPEMDGYTLTAEIRKDPRLQGLYVLLHSSLSGVFNSAMVEKVGADKFIPKFNPDELAEAVLGSLKSIREGGAAAAA